MVLSADVRRHDTWVQGSVSNPLTSLLPPATLVQDIRDALSASKIISYAQVHRDSRWRVRCDAYLCDIGLQVTETGGCGVQAELAVRKYRARAARMLHHPQRVNRQHARARQHSKFLLRQRAVTMRSRWLRVLQSAQGTCSSTTTHMFYYFTTRHHALHRHHVLQRHHAMHHREEEMLAARSARRAAHQDARRVALNRLQQGQDLQHHRHRRSHCDLCCPAPRLCCPAPRLCCHDLPQQQHLHPQQHGHRSTHLLCLYLLPASFHGHRDRHRCWGRNGSRPGLDSTDFHLLQTQLAKPESAGAP